VPAVQGRRRALATVGAPQSPVELAKDKLHGVENLQAETRLAGTGSQVQCAAGVGGHENSVPDCPYCLNLGRKQCLRCLGLLQQVASGRTAAIGIVLQPHQRDAWDAPQQVISSRGVPKDVPLGAGLVDGHGLPQRPQTQVRAPLHRGEKATYLMRVRERGAGSQLGDTRAGDPHQGTVSRDGCVAGEQLVRLPGKSVVSVQGPAARLAPRDPDLEAEASQQPVGRREGAGLCGARHTPDEKVHPAGCAPPRLPFPTQWRRGVELQGDPLKSSKAGITGDSGCLHQAREAASLIAPGQKGGPVRAGCAAQAVQPDPTPPAGDAGRLLSAQGPHVVHDRAHRHQRGADRLAGPAFKTAPQMCVQPPRRGEPAFREALRERDAAPGRFRLVLAKAVGGTVGQAEAALDALIRARAETVLQVMIVHGSDGVLERCS